MTVSDSALRTPHSAPHQPEQADQAKHPADTPETPHSAHTDSEHRGWWGRVRGHVVPPEIWQNPRPGLGDLWAYARHGTWTDGPGPWRRAGQLYALLVALPLHAAGYWLLWLVERPTRLAGGVLLAVAIGHTGDLNTILSIAAPAGLLLFGVAVVFPPTRRVIRRVTHPERADTARPTP